MTFGLHTVCDWLGCFLGCICISFSSFSIHPLICMQQHVRPCLEPQPTAKLTEGIDHGGCTVCLHPSSLSIFVFLFLGQDKQTNQ